MNPGPPPLPPPSPTPPPLDGEPLRTRWIGLVVALIAALILMLLVARIPKGMPRSEVETDGKSEDRPALETSEPLLSDAAEIPADSVDASLHPAIEPNVIEKVRGPGPETSVSTATGDQDADETQPETEVPPAVDGTTPNVSPVEKPSRVHTLNIGNGFATLTTGASNPLRVGSEVQSVVYVIDQSSSMTGDRFNHVCKSLRDAIDGLDESQEFAVILFHSHAWPVGELALIPATLPNKAAIIHALSKVITEGGTSPLEAMKHAIDLQADAIVLLSDGEFNDLEASQITQYNHRSGSPTTIHCIGLQRNINTLRRIAEDNGHGIYTTADLQRP